MLEPDRLVAAVEIPHFAVAHIDRADSEPHLMGVDIIEVDQLGKRFAQRLGRVVGGTLDADGEVRPEPRGRVGPEERRKSPRHRRHVGDGAAEPREEFRRADAGALFDAVPERMQALEPAFRRIAGDQRGVNRADRRADHPVGLDSGFVQGGIHADLISTQRAPALEHEHHLPRQCGPAGFRGAIATSGNSLP